MATKAGQVWSWDITKLRGPTRGVWYDLYVALDIFSRFVVAWTIAACEDGDIAKAMLEEAMGVHGIPDGPPGRRRRIPRPSPGRSFARGALCCGVGGRARRG
jgi:transposase InsO family protein